MKILIQALINGTCVRLENELQRDLLRLMCRHHIHEIVVKDVYRYLFSSGAPTNLFHPILAEAWSELKSNNFRFDGFGEHEKDIFYFENENQVQTYENFKELALQQLGGHCNHPFIRDDYMEIVKVSLKFLSGDREILTKANQVQFNALQNPSNARFMASSIQALKSRGRSLVQLLFLDCAITLFSVCNYFFEQNYF